MASPSDLSLPPPLDSRKCLLAHSDTENESNPENGWNPARVKKQKRQDNRSTDSNSSAPNNVAKFKANAASSTDGYRKISAFNTKFPNLKFTSRPNLRGEWILTSSDNRKIQTLRTTSELNLTELKRENKLIKAVVVGFPFSIPASELAKHGKIVHVERLRNKEGQETKAMLCSFIVERLDRIDLGVWGTFPLRTYYPEPHRCYNCQRFEHHKSTCFSETRCAVCSGRHETSVCINKHKKGEQTNADCPNCKSNHPAWSRRCPERLNRIQAKVPERTAPIPKPRKHLYTRAELQRHSLSRPPRTNSQKRAPSMTSFNQSRNTPVTLPRTIFCQTENIKHCFSSFVQVALISANASLSNDKIQVLARDFVESLWHVSRTHQPPTSSSSSSQPSSSSASSSSSSSSSSHSSHTTTPSLLSNTIFPPLPSASSSSTSSSSTSMAPPPSASTTTLTVSSHTKPPSSNSTLSKPLKPPTSNTSTTLPTPHTTTSSISSSTSTSPTTHITTSTASSLSQPPLLPYHPLLHTPLTPPYHPLSLLPPLLLLPLHINTNTQNTNTNTAPNTETPPHQTHTGKEHQHARHTQLEYLWSQY